MPVNVVEVSRSPHARLRPVPLDCVDIVGGFWERWVGETARAAIRHQYRMLEESDRLKRFRWAAGRSSERPTRSVFPFDDSDVYKWLEACGFYFAKSKEDKLKGVVESVIDDIVASQEEDGYLFTEHHGAPERRWKNLTFDHELYCAGHLIQGAIALHRSTGETKLFHAALKLADLISKEFNPDGIRGVCGHPEIEMALIELYRETGERKYLKTAEFFINERGRDSLRPSPEDRLNNALYRILGGASYFVDHKPARELDEIVGHAVRALYLNCGVTDLYMESGEEALLWAMERLWRSFVERKMYITGAAGSRYVSEAFGEDYELPNERAYAETCAAIASFMWNWRMLLATAEARFADVMELTLYNSILSGVSLDGKQYFYMNPLASSGGYMRSPWFPCACCPPNIARLLASLPGYFYSTSEKGL
ncbi:MAG: glycoside hydrolase family 127 protein, partial [Nitrososphaerota archaeon]